MSDEKRFSGRAQGSGNSFDATMRSALQLTQNQHVIEATRVLRRAFAGRGPVLPTESVPREMPPLIGSDAETALAARAAASHPRHTLDTVLDLFHRPEARTPGFGIVSPSALCEPQPLHAPEGAAYLGRTHTCSAGVRDYRLYVPAAAAGHSRGLVVMLHGCTQTPDDFAAGTGMNTLAEEHGFVVAYPWQSTSANQSGCWNWFKPQDQLRDRGEPAILASLTTALVREYDIDAAKVFVCGLSAGGAMAAILAATYPDLYRAVGIHSGLADGAASDLVSAFAAMRGTPVPPAPGQRQPPSRATAAVRTIVFHGTSDQTVHPANGDAIYTSARSRLNGAAETLQRGHSAGGLSYTRKVVADAQGRPQLEHWTIDGLGHAWSGGRPDGSYTDLNGPDASREMIRFFLAAEPDRC